MNNRAIDESNIDLVEIDQITKDPSFQVRNSLSEPQIKRYMEVLRTGGALPPIKVAVVEKMLILVDGWHRLAAFEALGKRNVPVEFITASKKEVGWLAAEANLTHGVPLKRGEYRSVYKGRKKYQGQRSTKVLSGNRD